MECVCERCGFQAKSKEKLIKHVKDGFQCRPLKSKISQKELLEKLKPSLPIEQLTCSYCNSIFKSKGGLTVHLKHCKNKEQRQEDVFIHTDTNINNSNERPITKELYSFNKIINWDKFSFNEEYYINCCKLQIIGVIELFKKLHENPQYDNIKYINDKLMIFNGKKWIKATDDVIINHLGLLFSTLEEKWFDYQSKIRCGLLDDNQILDKEIQYNIDKFFYEDIVDNDSIYFHCKDKLLENIKRN